MLNNLLRKNKKKKSVIPQPIKRAREIAAHTELDAVFERRVARDGDKGILRSPTRMYSQNFEDAIISEIAHRLNIETGYFVEIGIGDGTECNTRLLLETGWSGIWIEGSAERVERAKAKFAPEIADGRLRVIHAFLYRDTINATLAEHGVPNEVDFLSLDTDMHTHTLWAALEVTAKIACLEYNSSVPPRVDWAMSPEAPDIWAGDNNFGASLKHFEKIGAAKDMQLVGCDLMGVNAFFLQSALAEDRFHTRTDAEFHHEPPRYHFIKAGCGHPRADRKLPDVD